jgi:hypothetical protein
VLRIAARLAVVVLAFSTGCGGGGGDSDTAHDGVDAFPDVVEIARAELGEDAALHSVTVSESEIAFVHVQFGRTTRVKYDSHAVFTGNERAASPRSSAELFPMSDVQADAPAKLLQAIQAREGGDVAGFTATLARDARGALLWRVKATVGGGAKEYDGDADGTLRA